MDHERIPMICLSYFGTAMPDRLRNPLPVCAGPSGEPPPDVHPDETDRELLAVSVTNLQGTYLGNKALYRWLLAREPVAVIGYSIYVYNLTGDAAAHWSLANVYLEAGPSALAIPELKKVVKIRPDNAAAHNNLGVVLASRRQPDKAIDQFREAARLQPHYVDAHYNLGRALAECGRLGEAVEQYQRALEDNPDSAHPRRPGRCPDPTRPAGRSGRPLSKGPGTGHGTTPDGTGRIGQTQGSAMKRKTGKRTGWRQVSKAPTLG